MAYLTELRPDMMLVLGRDAWEAIPMSVGSNLFAWKWSDAPEALNPFVITLPDAHRVICDFIQHPSRAFSWERWAPKVDALRKLNAAVRQGEVQ